MARKYPVGIQTFSEIIRGGYTYVDKTDVSFLRVHHVPYLLNVYVRTQVKCASGKGIIIIK